MKGTTTLRTSQEEGVESGCLPGPVLGGLLLEVDLEISVSAKWISIALSLSSFFYCVAGWGPG